MTEKIKAVFTGEDVVTEQSDQARELYDKSRFGSISADKKLKLGLIEAYYLYEKKKIELTTKTGKKIDPKTFIKKAQKLQPNFSTRYAVFKDMRDRGYIIKTALKFGADFRVYERGVKPGEDHAKWIIYPVHESESQTWYEFAAKNRVAHSTKKRLLIGIVDDEGDVTYYEIAWKRP
jgi:tRNA-intron endonuclease